MKTISSLWKKYSFFVLFAVVIASLFDFRLALIVISCMIGPIVLSFFKGRFWCGNICPRGSFFDNVLSKVSRHKKVPPFLKSTFFRVVVFILMMTLFALGIKKNWGSWSGIGFVFYRMIVVTTIIGIVFSFIWNERTWCHFCPMGSASALISHFRSKARVLKVSNSCISCGICAKNCPMGINASEYKGDFLKASDCIQCGKCSLKCPKKAISY